MTRITWTEGHAGVSASHPHSQPTSPIILVLRAPSGQFNSSILKYETVKDFILRC